MVFQNCEIGQCSTMRIAMEEGGGTEQMEFCNRAARHFEDMGILAPWDVRHEDFAGCVASRYDPTEITTQIEGLEI